MGPQKGEEDPRGSLPGPFGVPRAPIFSLMTNEKNASVDVLHKAFLQIHEHSMYDGTHSALPCTGNDPALRSPPNINILIY